MIARKLLSPGRLPKGKVITFSDNTLLSERTATPYTCPPHIPGPGILTMLTGSGRYGINREVSTLDSSSYLLINQDSLLSVHLPHPDVQPLLLFFRTDMVRDALTRQQADLCWLERVHPMTSQLQQRLSAAREWIHANYPAAISLEAMAESALMNPQHFLRMFRDCYGITPHQFVIDVRLTVARQLLTETKQPVSAICRQTGFESFSSFSGLFRRRFGSSPTAYREK